MGVRDLRSSKYTSTTHAPDLETNKNDKGSDVVKSTSQRSERTNQETLSICMLFVNPHALIPTPANKTADWFTPLLPITLLKHPYSGVNVHVVSKSISVGEKKDGSEMEV